LTTKTFSFRKVYCSVALFFEISIPLGHKQVALSGHWVIKEPGGLLENVIHNAPSQGVRENCFSTLKKNSNPTECLTSIRQSAGRAALFPANPPETSKVELCPDSGSPLQAEVGR
jgi:hypothetical protein